MEASGLLAECFDASYEAWKPDIRSSGVRLCSASVQDISCLPASSIVFALFTSRSSVYPHSGQTNVLSESVMSSVKAPQRGHILVDGKNLSKIRTFGFLLPEQPLFCDSYNVMYAPSRSEDISSPSVPVLRE